MVYDCFTFFNELDLLEIRLNVLDDVVDRFVICEAPWTHTGKPKELVFEKNAARFSRFAAKIIHIVAFDPPVAPADFTERQHAWLRENWQRNELVRGLVDARPDDTVLISDLDEIPRPESVKKVIGLDGVTRFGMRFFNFFLNYRNYSVYNWPIGTQACSYSTFLDERTYAGFRGDEYTLKEFNEGPTMTKLRMAGAARSFRDAGWHFSYCGGMEMVIEKFKAFAHTELNTAKTTSIDEIRRTFERGETSVVCRGYRFFAVRVDDSYPRYIRENREKYAAFFLNVDDGYFRRVFFARHFAYLGGLAYRVMVKLIPPFLVPFALKVRSAMHRRRFGS